MQHHERLLTLVGCVRGIVLELDANGRYLNAWADDPALLARPAAEMIGRTIDDVLGPAGAPFTEMVRRVHGSGVIENLEYPIDLPTGRRWFYADVKRVTSADGEMTVIFFARDITDRKHAEEALARSEERFRLAARATNDVLWDWDINGHTVTCNEGITTLLGYAEVSPDPNWWRERIHPDDRPEVYSRLLTVLARQDQSWSDSYRFRRADGSYGDFVDRGFIIRDEAGCAIRMVGSMTEVTKINRLQAQLLQAERLAALGTLAAGVGHEINNPLSYVMGNLEAAIEMLGDDPKHVDEPVALMREALEGSRRIADIVKSLRLFTRGDETDMRPVDVHAVLDAAIKMADQEIRHRARLVRALDGAPRVLANESQLAQVFLNLLINAAQAIPEGSSETNEVRITSGVDAGGGIVITIQDTGSGIAPENLSRVFDPFFTTKAVGVGTGLGLSICHGIIEKHGGEIGVASELGRGTTFTVRLPPHAAPAQALPRVLVVDDDAHIGRLISRMFRNRAEVVATTSGRDALSRLLSSDHFDLVLCDLMMPELTGVDLRNELRRRNPHVLRSTYFMTGGAFTPRCTEFLDELGSACLEKPLDRGQLLSLLDSVTSQRAADVGSGRR